MIRAPNHLGELVLALPALERAAALWPSPPPLVQLPASLAPLLELSDAAVEPVPMENRHRLLREAGELRRRGASVGVLLTPSFSSALLLRLAGIGVRRGTDTDARGWLLTDRVDREPLLRGHRVREYLALVEGAAPDRRLAEDPEVAVDRDPDPLPRPRLRATPEARRAWEAAAGAAGVPSGEPRVGLVPGGRASSRRWPVGRWRDLAGRLAGRGLRTVVFGAGDERGLTASVADGRPAVHDLGGRTGLAALAGGLAACDAVVANDTGPMHVAAALRRPVLAVWGAGDPRQTRPPGEHVRPVGTFDLPCHPCVENACPRRGRGYRLDEARRECLRLVTVDRVAEELEGLLERAGPAGPEGTARSDRSARPDGRERERAVESGPVREDEP